MKWDLDEVGVRVKRDLDVVGPHPGLGPGVELNLDGVGLGPSTVRPRCGRSGSE